MEQHTAIRITRSISSGKHLNQKNSSTQTSIFKTPSERQITPQNTKCCENGSNTCNVKVCDCGYEEEIKQKPDQLGTCKSNQNPPPGYGISSHSTGFQIPPNTNQMPFNQARFSCPCPGYQAPGSSPTDDELWDLQFCRWWGWNWIRKREEMANKKQCEMPPKKNCSCQIDQQRNAHKHPRKKRDFFGWCNGVLGSNKKRQSIDIEERQRLNELYDTPSCSTNECICPADDWECRSLDFKGEYSCCNSTGKTTSMSTIIIKNRKCCHLKKSRSLICEKMDSTTSEECCAPCKSSTGESSDCVTLHLKCVKSKCRDKIPCECSLKRNRNVCPCRVQLCEKPKYVCCEPACCEPVCCEPVCRPRKKKSSPFICLPSRKPPLPCKPIPLLRRPAAQRQPPCCVPKLCHPPPPCKYRFPKYIKRCPQQTVGCVIPKKEYVVCCRQKCKKPKICCTNEKTCCCCCCNCCCCKDQPKSVICASKRAGTTKTSSGKQSDASDSMSSNQRSKIEIQKTNKKNNNPEKKSSVLNSLQHGKYVSPLSGRNYALDPKMVTVSPVVTKSKLPAPIDTNDEVFNFTSISGGDWEHTELLQAVCDAIMSARLPNEETKTLPKDSFTNWSTPEKLSESIGDSKLIEENQKYNDSKSSPGKENTFLNSLLETLDDKYFNSLEKNFPKFTPLASLPEEENVDLQCESRELDETFQQKSTEESSMGSNWDLKKNDEPGPSRSLIPFNSPRTWLTAPKLSSASISGLFSSATKKPAPKNSNSEIHQGSSKKKSNVYDVLFSKIEPNFQPSDSKIFSPQSHSLLLHEIPRADIAEHTQTSNFVFNPIQVLENEQEFEVKPKKSKIPVLMNRESSRTLHVSPRSTSSNLIKNVVREEEVEREIFSEFLDKKCSSIFSNVQPTVSAFNASNFTDKATSFSEMISGVPSESSKEILRSFPSFASTSSGLSLGFKFSVPKASSPHVIGSDVLAIPPNKILNAGPPTRKMQYTKLRKHDLGEDVVTAKCMKRESPFSMFCKPVKTSNIVNLPPMSAKRSSLLLRPEKNIFLKETDRSQN